MKTKTRKALAWRLLSILVILSVLMPVALFVAPVPVALADTVTLNPNQDSFVRQDSGGNDNYGSSSDLRVRSNGRFYWSEQRNNRTYVQFDLSSIPSGSTINSAELRLYMYDAPNQNRTYRVHRVTQSWGETTITWNNAASYDSTVTASTSW